MGPITLRLVDRTRTVTDWKCPRARFWGYEFKGRGIVKSGTSLPLFTGIILHDALAAIAIMTQADKPVPIDDIADAAFTQLRSNLIESAGANPDANDLDFANEQAALTEGIIRGFYKHVWPQLMAKFTILHVETEMEYALHNDGQVEFVFMTKPDLIVEDHEGNVVYLEYKSTSSKQDKWIASWETAVQLHSSIMATESTIGIRPAYVQIVGMYKGYESYGKQSSPFCYAYKRSGNPPFTTDQVEYAYKAGFRRYPTWELKGGVKEWVASMPYNILTNQFPMTAPIFVNEHLVEAFFRQRAIREQEIARTMSTMSSENELDLMDATFPQHFDQCVPSFGWSCEYKRLCHSVVDNPLDSGFELRIPHHERELEGL